MQSFEKLHGLFINPAKANCSIYESGRMMYESLLVSDKYELAYLEIDENNRAIPDKYDFYAFNYHYLTMGWLDTRSVRRLPGLKVTFVLEVLPNDPFVSCPADDFDAYCVLDPTMRVADRRVYAFPRPLEVPDRLPPYREPAIPIIGSFGFATPGKGFELVVDAVNKEFKTAVVRINIPSGTYADDPFWKLHKRNYAEYLGDLCKRVAKKGVEVVITHNYMSKDELIGWCGQNTLNCFLYNRNQPGLSATTDQAISSGRPLTVSVNETFRHIHRYIEPYPLRSLKESLVLSQQEVLQMQKEWAPENFAAKFEEVLYDFGLFRKMERDQLPVHMMQLQKKTSLQNLVGSVTSKMSKFYKSLGFSLKDQKQQLATQRQLVIMADEVEKKVILFVSHKKKQCGIHQYAININEALQKSARYAFRYAECCNQKELRKAVVKANPAAIIYNYYPATMPWLTGAITRQYLMPQLGIMHEVTQEEADKANKEMFDFHLCPDPTLIENNPIVFKTKRLIPSYINTINIPDIVTIGSFGFGFGDKGFERIVKTVQQDFNHAKIVLHMPFNDVVDKKGRQHALLTAERCRRLVTKPGIELVINHEFMKKQQLLDFLASNTVNAFFYETEKQRGISSTIEHALAVQRPMAITKCGMFRHVLTATPSICIEDSSLKEIINNGIAPLVPFYNEWCEAAFIKDYETILDRVFSPMAKNQQKFNAGG